MSSSQRQPNNPNTNNPNFQSQYSDYDIEESANSHQHSHPTEYFPSRGPSEHVTYQYQEDVDEDLPNEIVAELDAQEHAESNVQDEDDYVFSDAVQDAFKKYQNEQEELYAQMEECWNYMNQEQDIANIPGQLAEPSQSSQLNPDANEFQPTWWKPPTTLATPRELTTDSAASAQFTVQKKHF